METTTLFIDSPASFTTVNVSGLWIRISRNGEITVWHGFKLSSSRSGVKIKVDANMLIDCDVDELLPPPENWLVKTDIDGTEFIVLTSNMPFPVCKSVPAPTAVLTTEHARRVLPTMSFAAAAARHSDQKSDIVATAIPADLVVAAPAAAPTVLAVAAPDPDHAVIPAANLASVETPLQKAQRKLAKEKTKYKRVKAALAEANAVIAKLANELSAANAVCAERLAYIYGPPFNHSDPSPQSTQFGSACLSPPTV